MAQVIRKIALLSTGNEIVNGDIINTNTQILAKRLFEQNIQPGLHLTVNDNQLDIEEAIRFLLIDHAALIITGGLGPTSDDRTRFALANAIRRELLFDSTCWQNIIQRLERLNLPVAETNRQQCLFPHNATIFPNDNGTAAACLILHYEQPIFMLPGPPFECLPIFETHVLPYLKAHDYAQTLFRCEWLLLGASESSVAEWLDPLMENSGCYVGYRIDTPYLEVKLQSTDAAALEKLRSQFDARIGGQTVSTRKQKASTQLKQWIIEHRCLIHINDKVTGGLLASALLSPESYPYIHFNSHLESDNKDLQVTLTGLEPYWQGQPDINELNIEILQGDRRNQVTHNVQFRKDRTPLWAMEIAAWAILTAITGVSQ